MILIPFDQLFDLPEKEQPFVLDRKVSFEAYASLLDNRSVPVTTAWDHDLLLHVLPIIRSGIDFTSIFKNIDSVKDIRCKIFAFETMFLIAYDMLYRPRSPY